MGKIVLLKKPLTKRALKNRADKDGRISVNIAIDLNSLIDSDLESINDFADETIIDTNVVAGSLSDISYKVVGSIPVKSGYFNGSVIINVNADVSDIINDNE